MNRLIVFVFILFGHLTFGQNKYPTKTQLQRTLTQKTERKRHTYNSTNWFTLESDSSFKMADTLIFYNNSDYRYGQLICYFVDWNFYEKNSFWEQHVQLCKEPTTATDVNDLDMFTFEILDKQSKLVMQIFNKGLLVDQFDVLSLTKQSLKSDNNVTTEVLKLHRIKANQTSDGPAANIRFAARLARRCCNQQMVFNQQRLQVNRTKTLFSII